MNLFNHSSRNREKARAVWQAIKNYFLPSGPKYASLNTDLNVLLFQGRDRILTVILRLVSLLGSFVILSIMGDLLRRGRWELVFTYLAGLIAIGVVSLLRRINYTGRVLTFLGILYVLGIVDLSYFGVAEDWRLYFSAFSIMAALFLGLRAGLFALLLSLMTFVILAWQISVGRIVITASAMESPIPSMENIFVFSMAFAVTNAIIIAAITTLLQEFENATKKERQAARKLEEKTAELEASLNREQQLASEVALALQREEELNKLRAKMIATISHEFRTPLTVIKNSTSLLEKYNERLSESKREEQFLRLRQSIHYLTDLLQGVSLMESTQGRPIQPRQELVQFGQLSQRLISELREETDNPLNLKVEVNGDEKALLVLDYHLLRQVVLNLLSNALHYSPSHLPVTLLFVLGQDLTITIADQGIGIPESEKDKVWEPFYRGSNVDAHDGLGLGLYVVKKILEPMAGKISLTDGPAGGTIFTVKLPLKLPAGNPAP